MRQTYVSLSLSLAMCTQARMQIGIQYIEGKIDWQHTVNCISCIFLCEFWFCRCRCRRRRLKCQCAYLYSQCALFMCCVCDRVVICIQYNIIEMNAMANAQVAILPSADLSRTAIDSHSMQNCILQLQLRKRVVCGVI